MYVLVFVCQHTNCFSKFSADGEVFAFGSNFNGQLGLGADVNQSILPARIISLKSNVISDVACGESHTAFITGGRLFSDPTLIKFVLWTCECPKITSQADNNYSEVLHYYWITLLPCVLRPKRVRCSVVGKDDSAKGFFLPTVAFPLSPFGLRATEPKALVPKKSTASNIRVKRIC